MNLTNKLRMHHTVTLMAVIALNWASPSLAQDEARVKAGLDA